MTPEEARARFSEAQDGSLARGEQHAFERLLASDEGLRSEYERFVEVVQAAQTLSDDGEGEVDLLPSLQARLRTQSRGRFYRDRFAQQRSSLAVPVLVVSGGVLVLVALWFALRAGAL